MSKFKRVALIGKYKSPEIKNPLLRLAAFLVDREVKVFLDNLTAANIGSGKYECLSLDEIGKSVDLAIVVGGDGTMLNIARTLAPYNTALVGVNQGRLGFLTDLSIESMQNSIELILKGDYVVEERMLLDAEVTRNFAREKKVLALNDVSVNKGADGGLIELEVLIDGAFVCFLRADGLIITTPTGSTAYALSAGGPILHPSLNCMGLVPVSAHTLSNRPIVLNKGALIEVKILKACDGRVNFDSHSHYNLKENDRISVRSASSPIRLLHPKGHNYYAMLRQKLHWSDSL